MDEKEYRLLILETIQETTVLSKKLLETPLLMTEEDLVHLDYNLKMISDYSQEIKKNRGIQ